MPLADMLLRIAAGPRLYIPKWSDQIMEEVGRTLHEDFGLSEEKVRHREREIRRHFHEAWINGYQHLIPSMTNHPKDRHVLAAAAHAHVGTIVTYNTTDFPPLSLAPYSIRALGPSTSLKNLYATSPTEIMEVLEAQAAAIGETLRYVLSRLRVNVPGFVAAVEKTT